MSLFLSVFNIKAGSAIYSSHLLMSGKEYKALLEGEHKVLEISSRHGGCWQRITYSKSSFFFIIIIFTHKGSVPLKKKKILSTVLDVLITKKGYYLTRRFTKAERKLFVSKKDDEACLLKSM